MTLKYSRKKNHAQRKGKRTTLGIQKDLMQKYFLEHIRSEKQYEKYREGLNFLKNFKFSIYRGEEHSFLVSLSRNYTLNPISVSLSTNIQNQQKPIFFANIRFTKGRVVIETLQGTPWLKEMREFERVVNIPSSRFLVREITQQAKKMGFDKVLLIDPTKHGSYKDPYLMSLFDEKTKELQQKVIFKEATKEERREYDKRRKEVLRVHQERMRKLYENVARGEGFIKKGNYFVKDLK